MLQAGASSRPSLKYLLATLALPPCRLVHQAEACDGAARSARLASEQLQAQADELLRRAEASQREADELER